MMTMKFIQGGFDRRTAMFLIVLFGATVLISVLSVATQPGDTLHVPTYVVSLVGKYLCFALLAISVDLIWGYCGILSLGHTAFFGLGGVVVASFLFYQGRKAAIDPGRAIWQKEARWHALCGGNQGRGSLERVLPTSLEALQRDYDALLAGTTDASSFKPNILYGRKEDNRPDLNARVARTVRCLTHSV